MCACEFGFARSAFLGAHSVEKKIVGLENELLALVKEKITLNEVCDDLKVCDELSTYCATILMP